MMKSVGWKGSYSSSGEEVGSDEGEGVVEGAQGKEVVGVGVGDSPPHGRRGSTRIIVIPFHVPSPASASIARSPPPNRHDEGAAQVKGAAMAFCSCFGPSKAERREADLAESEEARAKAAEAAQRRQLLDPNLPPSPSLFLQI
ncbi:hypothetical protein GW17_00011142 [Ensete ventricosum]|nr:hypothetical protein GW17_00011142 [Ensete ventricosum]